MPYGVYLPGRWRSQPQGAVEIDWRHPLARRLDGFLTYNGGAWRELASRYPLTVLSRGVGVSPVGLGAPGNEVTGTGETGVRSTSGTSQRENDMEVTLFVSGYLRPSSEVPSGTASGNLIRAGQNLIVRGGFSDGRSVIFEILMSNFTLSRYEDGALLSFARPYGLSMSRREGTGGFNCYHNGRNINSSDGQSGPTRGDAGVSLWNLQINQRDDGGTGHIVHAGARWRRALSDGEHRAMHENPWQILRPRRPILYSLSSSTPVLSAATVIDIGTTSARPRVTITI